MDLTFKQGEVDTCMKKATDKYEKGKEQKRAMMGRKGEEDAILDRVVGAECS